MESMVAGSTNCSYIGFRFNDIQVRVNMCNVYSTKNSRNDPTKFDKNEL